MAREDPKFMFRMPAELKARVEDAARSNGRSINAELLARVESSFEAEAAATAQRRMLLDVNEQLQGVKMEIDALEASFADRLNALNEKMEDANFLDRAMQRLEERIERGEFDPTPPRRPAKKG